MLSSFFYLHACCTKKREPEKDAAMDFVGSHILNQGVVNSDLPRLL